MFNSERLQQFMAAQSLDAVIATTRENILYFTGYDPVIKKLNPYHGQSFALVTRDSPALVHVVHPAGEADQLLDARAPLGEVALYGTFYRECAPALELAGQEASLRSMMETKNEGPTPVSALHGVIERLGLKTARIAIDEDGVTAGVHQEIKATKNSVTWFPGAALIRRIRAVKTSFEVDLLTASARIVEAGYVHAAGLVRPGTSEVELKRHYEQFVTEKGAIPALSMLKIGRNAVMGQRRQDPAIKAQLGDVVWFDCDAIFEGYWADIARTFVLGHRPDFEAKYAALAYGQEEAIAAIRPGMTGGEIFDLTMRTVHSAGFTAYRRHHVGHGIGLEPYERPILAPGNQDIVEVGNVLSIETPYYEFGLGALHVEDPIVVGTDGNRRLTTTSREIGILNNT
jgi:Xaa-Pro aminopeptidase